MTKFVIRLDDICPTMDHAKFARARAIFDEAGVKPLMGIVPDNQDPDLQIDAPDPAFWKTMRDLKAQGWGISQHGYQHRIHTSDRGLLDISPRSEFAGRALADQTDDLVFPWDEAGLRFIPQLSERPVHFGFGIYTMCLHLNNMRMDEIENLGKFVTANAARIIRFDDASAYNGPTTFAKPLSILLKVALSVRRRGLEPRM